MNDAISQKPLKIIHIVDYLMPTMGYQEFLLPKWNAKHGHEVHIITSDRYYPVPNYSQTWEKLLGKRIVGTRSEIIEEVTVHRLNCAAEVKFRPYIPELTSKITELVPDIIFCHGTASLGSIQSVKAAKKLNIPLIMDNHMTFGCKDQSIIGQLGYFALKQISQKYFDKYTYRFLGVANECCDFLIRAQGLPEEKVENLPIGIDTDIFTESPEGRTELREKYDIPEGAFVIMQTGKLTADKSPHYLTQAAASLMKENKNLYLVFVGSGGDEYMKEVSAPLEEAAVTEQTKMLPLMPAKELKKAYSAADLLVYPDATSLSCMEAGACKRGAIISDLPASKWRESLGVGECYKTGDVKELKEKISFYLNNPNKLQHMAEKSKEAVLKNFSYDAIAARSEEIMREAVEKNKRITTD
ncbi:MAG: glycosyltransferase family 4 protein [Planctomycetota bacterium]|jgi:glycosyltransferase involved in cell wall biosynthesis